VFLVGIRVLSEEEKEAILKALKVIESLDML